MDPSTHAARTEQLVTTMCERMAHITRTLSTWIQDHPRTLTEIEQQLLRWTWLKRPAYYDTRDHAAEHAYQTFTEHMFSTNLGLRDTLITRALAVQAEPPAPELRQLWRRGHNRAALEMEPVSDTALHNHLPDGDCRDLPARPVGSHRSTKRDSALLRRCRSAIQSRCRRSFGTPG